MRPIKFRAWQKTHKYLTFDISMRGSYDGTQIFYYTDPDDGIRVDDGWVLMQFTGLHDKNGKEIYEGDIVKAYTYFDEEEKELCDSTVHEIVWGDDYPAFEMRPAPAEDCNSLQLFVSVQYDGERIEVIGNIHENPELVKP
jgi:uncharacterized phage protein (TIGR01671 family)